tara:strand:- start:1767 stop:3530 length:1764 start_codon:yes stop_codon:yes gene_type:complete
MIEMFLNNLNLLKNNQIELYIFLWKISNRKLRYDLFAVIITSTLAAFLELITLLVANKFLEVLTLISTSSETFNKIEKTSLYSLDNLYSVSVIFLILIISTGILRIISLRNSVFITASFGNRLFYLSYLNIIKNTTYINSNQAIGGIIAGLTKELDDATQYVVRPLINVFSSSIISAFILGALISSANIYILILIISILILYYLYSGKIRKKLERNSYKKSFIVKQFITFLNDCINSLDELILIRNKENLIIRANNDDKEIRNFAAKSGFIQESPRYIVESLLFASITLFTIISFIFLDNKVITLANIGTLLLGLQKLLPVMQNIYGSYASIKSHSDSLLTVKKFIVQKEESPRLINYEDISFKNWELKLDNISFSYSKSEITKRDLPILQNFSLIINKGDKILLNGDSGSGKSTLLRLICTITKPSSGKIFFDGQNIWESFNNLYNLRSQISYLPQNANIFSGSLIFNITLENDIKKINFDKAYKCLKDASLYNFVNSLEEGLNTIVSSSSPPTLSGGQYQRLALARALYRDSKILIIDEATSSLDVNNELSIISNLTSRDDLTIICSSHSNIEKYFSRNIKLSKN